MKNRNLSFGKQLNWIKTHHFNIFCIKNGFFKKNKTKQEKTSINIKPCDKHQAEITCISHESTHLNLKKKAHIQNHFSQQLSEMALEFTVGIYFVILYLSIPLVMLFLQWFNQRNDSKRLNQRERAIVLVLGDLGRSPRMLYHAQSLAKGGLDVDLCGYDGEYWANAMFRYYYHF